MGNKGKTFETSVLTAEEVTSLMDACSKRAPTGKRDRALICFLWRSQLRISEALRLKPSDIQPDGTVRVQIGKGKKYRTVAVDQKCLDVLAVWMEARSHLDGVNGRQPVFCTLRGGKIATAQIREKLPKLAAKAGIEKRVHAHGLRRTGASEMVDEGISLLDIKEQLGHSSIATTDKYVQSINPKARLERMKQREW
ncbi:MAG: site-specific integrase [Pirellulales bacterium]|nr:site-specific integrase [Pirellulales bacterium]